MSEPNKPIRLAKSEKNRAAQMLSRAFQDDPAYTALFPDQAEREQALQRLFGAVVGYSLVYGLVHTTPAVEGAACWLSPGNTEVTVWRMLRTGLRFQRAVARFKSEARRNFLATLAYMDEIHKREVTGPHWYLWALGVEPDRQGKGIGGRLLQPVLSQADRDGALCYLETQTETNVAFYQKRGFEVVNDSVVPDQDIRVWAMLRDVRRRNDRVG
jgi:GNAT superfamily N-acetyltransferase